MWMSEYGANEYAATGNNNEMPANPGDNGMAAPEMAMYPAVYYMLQPHVLIACDQMDMWCCRMPSHQMMMHMCDMVCDRVLKMHPEMAQYDTPYMAGGMADPPFGMQQLDRFRRRTPLRDLIFFLFLAEFRHRRRY